LHRAPNGADRSWKRADDGYRTCSSCYERLRGLLAEVADRYARLDPSPGAQASDGTRGSPGFGFKPPLSLHVVAMRDPRSSAEAHVWVGADGRVHAESDRPPLSIWSVLDTIAWDVAARAMDGHGQGSVAGLCGWLDGQLDWLTRRADITALHGTLLSLLSQLKSATGEPMRRVGRCPNTIDSGDTTIECGAQLYARLNGAQIATDPIRCRECGREWPRSEWLRLVDLLDAS